MIITDDVPNHITGGLVVENMSLDISAAFDMVIRDRLPGRLHEEFDITSATKDWITSDLSARCLLVRVEKSSSNIMLHQCWSSSRLSAESSVFTVYISFIDRLIEHFCIENYGYADDTQLFTALRGVTGPCPDNVSQCYSMQLPRY